MTFPDAIIEALVEKEIAGTKLGLSLDEAKEIGYSFGYKSSEVEMILSWMNTARIIRKDRVFRQRSKVKGWMLTKEIKRHVVGRKKNAL